MNNSLNLLYITYNTKNFDWHFSAWRNRDKTRWQSSKTIYDPCPPGWRVPDGGPYGVWKKAGFSNLSYDSSIEGIVCGDGISSPSTWYPAAGYRDRREGSLQCTNRMGQYWSVSHGEYGECFMDFSINSVGSATMGGGGKASARSVRCIRE